MGRSLSCRLALVLVLTVAGLVVVTSQARSSAQSGHTINGRVIDPHQLYPEDPGLLLGRPDGYSAVGYHRIPLGPDGSFVTGPLDPGTYVLRLVRNFSNGKPETLVGLTTVALGDSDLSSVRVEVRQDTALTGVFRMESDNPNAVWPPHISVSAWLALDGQGVLDFGGADGAPGGKFILRNAFGPRVLRCGYTLAPKSKWWPSKVLFDGVDVTDVPTDFNANENGRLEVWFTQHPARITGTVTDAQGQPIRAPWILIAAADRPRRQHWSSMSHMSQGNTRGEFSVAVAAGRYLVTAVPQETFNASQDHRKSILPMTSDGMPVEVKTREIKSVTVPVQRLPGR